MIKRPMNLSADNFTGFKNLQIIHCDGLDVFDSMNAMTAAKKHAIEKQEASYCSCSLCKNWKSL
jgi:hypothetical protein